MLLRSVCILIRILSLADLSIPVMHFLIRSVCFTSISDSLEPSRSCAISQTCLAIAGYVYVSHSHFRLRWQEQQYHFLLPSHVNLPYCALSWLYQQTHQATSIPVVPTMLLTIASPHLWLQQFIKFWSVKFYHIFIVHLLCATSDYYYFDLFNLFSWVLNNEY